LAREVVIRDPDLIIAFSTNLTLDFKATTTTVPIVGVFAAPIEAGIVPSLTLTAGNITGVSVDVGFGHWDTRIQFLQQAVPQLTRLWVIERRAMHLRKISNRHSMLETPVGNRLATFERDLISRVRNRKLRYLRLSGGGTSSYSPRADQET
jgi:hypothetical protein